MEIPKDIAQTASNLLQQPVHEFQAISKISTSPIKSKISIQGTLVQVSLNRNYFVEQVLMLADVFSVSSLQSEITIICPIT